MATTMKALETKVEQLTKQIEMLLTATIGDRASVAEAAKEAPAPASTTEKTVDPAVEQERAARRAQKELERELARPRNKALARVLTTHAEPKIGYLIGSEKGKHWRVIKAAALKATGVDSWTQVPVFEERDGNNTVFALASAAKAAAISTAVGIHDKIQAKKNKA